MTINETKIQLQKDLDFEVDNARIRRYADIIGVERKDNDYRDIDEGDYDTIRLVTCLFELGISQIDIENFLHDYSPTNFLRVSDQVMTKYNLSNVAFGYLGKHSFAKIPVSETKELI